MFNVVDLYRTASRQFDRNKGDYTVILCISPCKRHAIRPAQTYQTHAAWNKSEIAAPNKKGDANVWAENSNDFHSDWLPYID